LHLAKIVLLASKIEKGGKLKRIKRTFEKGLKNQGTC